jgi:energy-converting hydrogenase Eha subunit A
VKVKDSLIRAARTALQVFAATLAAVALGTTVNFNVVGNTYLAAAVLAAHAGVISLAQNLAEDNTDVDVPKG